MPTIARTAAAEALARCCPHLRPLLERALADGGASVIEIAEGRDMGEAVLVAGPLPWAALRRLDAPPFVHLRERQRLVFCERCWQSLAEWEIYRDRWS